jgi:hypothetical protein
MYNWLDENTEETQWLKLPALGMWCVSNTLTTVTRTVGIVEVFFKGLGILATSPFTNNRIDNAKIGLCEIFVHAPKNVLRTIFVPMDFLCGTIPVCVEPKHAIMIVAECMKINLLHAQNGTLKSTEHKKDLGYLQGVVKPKFMKYQGRTFKRLNPDL